MTPTKRTQLQSAYRSVSLLLALSWLGCASLPLPELAMPSFSFDLLPTPPEMGDIESLTPRGPGSVFATLEEAGVDALAYSYLESRQVVSSDRRARGGAIFPVEGGYSYDDPAVAGSGASEQLRYRLRSTDAAHFRHFPARTSLSMSAQHGSLSREARVFVEQRDPVNRPIFYLTPERFVRVYTASETGEQTLARVEWGARRGAMELEMRAAINLTSATRSEQPLAHRRMPGAMPTH